LLKNPGVPAVWGRDKTISQQNKRRGLRKRERTITARDVKLKKARNSKRTRFPGGKGEPPVASRQVGGATRELLSSLLGHSRRVSLKNADGWGDAGRSGGGSNWWLRSGTWGNGQIKKREIYVEKSTGRRLVWGKWVKPTRSDRRIGGEIRTGGAKILLGTKRGVNGRGVLSKGGVGS